MARKAHTAESIHWFLVYLLVLGTPFSIYPVVATSTRGLKPFLFFALLIILIGFARFCYGAAVRLNAATKSVLFFCGIALFSLVGFTVAGGSWADLMDYGSASTQLFIAAGLVLSVSTLRVDEKHLRRLVYVVLGISIVVSAYAIYQSMARIYDWPFAYPTIYNPSISPVEGAITRGGQFGPFIRPSAFFTEPTRLGHFLLTPTLLSLFLYLSAPERWNRTYLLLALVLTASAFILGFSMGSYVAMGAAIAVGLFVRGVRTYSIRVVLASVGALVVLSLLLYPILDVPLWEIVWIRAVAHLQVFGVEDIYSQSPFAVTSVSNRITRAQEGFQVWWNHPFLGVGINNFGRFFSQGVAPRIHSAFLQSLAEMGVLGGIAFLTLVFSAPITLLRRWSHFSGWEQSLYVAVGLGLLGRAVWMILAGNYILEFFWLDMVLATILLSYSSSARRRQGAIHSQA